MNSNTIIITGAPGQDSYFLTLELKDNYNIVLTYKNQESLRRAPFKFNEPNIKHVVLDVTNQLDCNRIITNYQPYGIINCAAISKPTICESEPKLAMEVNFIGLLNILNSVYSSSKHTRVVNCSSKYIFGNSYDYKEGRRFQYEKTIRKPSNIYGLSKNAAFEISQFFRSRGVFSSSAILYNHESLLRPDAFFLRKVCNWFRDFSKFRYLTGKGVDDFPLGKLRVGNLNTHLDISHASDICKGLIKIMKHEKAQDFILARGKNVSLLNILQKVALAVGVDDINGLYEIDNSFDREDMILTNIDADVGLAYYKLNWSTHISLDDIIKEMIDV